MNHLVSVFYNRVQNCFKYIKNVIDRKYLKNTNVSIISNHCMGGFIYHDLGLKFMSPTINLKILPDDFIELLEHLEYYMAQNIIEVEIPDSPCPVGMIPRRAGSQGDFIYIHFVHYRTFEQAKEKWVERSKRINWDNIVVMMTARDGCNESTLRRFECLPYSQRICYTNEPHHEYPHCKHVRLDDGSQLKGYISDMVNIFGKRAFECNGFNYVDFLNGGGQSSYL